MECSLGSEGHSSDSASSDYCLVRNTGLSDFPIFKSISGIGGGGGKDWEFGISRCKLLYIGWINDKVILYSTRNYIQYPVINHNGKEYEKEYTSV